MIKLIKNVLMTVMMGILKKLKGISVKSVKVGVWSVRSISV